MKKITLHIIIVLFSIFNIYGQENKTYYSLDSALIKPLNVKRLSISIKTCKKIDISKLSNLEYLSLYRFWNLDFKEAFIHLSNLPKLDTLIIRNSQLKDLSNIGLLTNLKYLKIEDYEGSSLTDEIGNLTNLKYLEINSSKITTLPTSIGNLINLETLIISNGSCDLTIPSEIGKLINLKELNIYNYHFKSLPNEIGKLVNLEETMLCGDLKELPNSIKNWRKIKDLYLDGNELTEIPSFIYNLNSLEYLDISNNNISYVSDSIKFLNNLKDLSIEGNIQIVKLPETICSLKKLKTINIENTKITALPICLSNNKNLKTISICKTLIENPKKIEEKFKNKIKWGNYCKYLESSLVDYSEIYGTYNLKLKQKKDTLILDYSYFYNEPGVMDEEYSRYITIKIINKDSLKINKIYSASNTNLVITTSHFSIWDWSKHNNYKIEGYMQFVKITNFKCKVYLDLDLIENNERQKIVKKLLIFNKYRW